MKNNRVREISASEFKEMLNDLAHPGHIHPIQKKTILGDIELNLSEVMSLSNCHFKGNLTINFIENNETILLTLNRVKIEMTLTLKAENKSELDHKHLNIRFSSIKAKQVKFANVKLKNWSIENANFEEISIENSELEKLEFGNSSISIISIKESTINENSEILMCKLKSFILNNSTFHKLLVFNGFEVENKVSINKSSIDEFIINTDYFGAKVEIENSISCNINIENSKFKNGFYIPRSANYSSYKIGELSVTGINSGSINIFGAIVDNFKSSDRGDIGFDFFECELNRFDCFRMNHKLKLAGIKSQGVNSSFKIRYSSLNQSYFFDVDLQSFSKLNFEKSDLSNFSNCQINWFHDDQIDSNETDQIKKYAYKRELYRQLKNNQEKQGDRIKALEFQSREMHFYKLEQKAISKQTKFSLKKRFKNLGDLIILRVGSINNHGQNFLKPVGLVLLLGLIVTFLFVLPSLLNNAFSLSSKISFNFANWDWSTAAKPEVSGNDYLNIWVQLLNPVHDPESIYQNTFDGNPIPTFLRWIDLFWRVFEAILIFQIIVAFRKYVRQ